MNLRALLAAYNSGVLRARADYARDSANLCGTPAGRARHQRSKTRVCADCAEAYNAAQRTRYTKRKDA